MANARRKVKNCESCVHIFKSCLFGNGSSSSLRVFTLHRLGALLQIVLCATDLL